MHSVAAVRFVPLAKGEPCTKITLFVSKACELKHPKNWKELQDAIASPFDRDVHRYKFDVVDTVHGFCTALNNRSTTNSFEICAKYKWVCTKEELSSAQQVIVSHVGPTAKECAETFSGFASSLRKCEPIRL